MTASNYPDGELIECLDELMRHVPHRACHRISDTENKEFEYFDSDGQFYYTRTMKHLMLIGGVHPSLQVNHRITKQVLV